MNLPKRYHPALVTLHWLVAILVFLNLVIGLFVLPNISSRFVTGIHILMGVVVLVLIIVRYIVRVSAKKPADATIGNKFLDLIGKLVHYALYVLLFVMASIGLYYEIRSGRLQYVLYNIQVQSGAALQIAGIPLFTIHKYMGFLLVFLLAGHIPAALFHQFVRKDHLLSRMWFERKA